MNKAYDTLLETEVNAEDVVPDSDDDYYRYECSCCGEQVILAAINSKKMVPHFRHLKDNNNTSCENYISSHESLLSGTRSRKSKRETFDLYYNNTQKMFYIGVQFDEYNLDWNEKENVILTILDENVTKLKSIRVNSQNFTSGERKKLYIETFNNTYYLENSAFGIRKIDVVSHDGPTFYRLLESYDNGHFCAKKMHGREVNEKCEYFMLLNRGYTFADQVRKCPGARIENVIDFKNKSNEVRCSGYLVCFEEKNIKAMSLLEEWGFKLVSGDELLVLWPPYYKIDEISYINKDNALVYSSFDLKAHQNTNLSHDDIKYLGGGIYELSINNICKILNRNNELIIKVVDFKTINIPFEENEIEQNQYINTSEEITAILMNKYGTRIIRNSEKVKLTKNTAIYEEKNTYTLSRITAKKDKKLLGRELLDDILKNYKCCIDISEVTIPSELSEIGSEYVRKCIKTGEINIAVLNKLIKGEL